MILHPLGQAAVSDMLPSSWLFIHTGVTKAEYFWLTLTGLSTLTSFLAPKSSKK